MGWPAIWLSMSRKANESTFTSLQDAMNVQKKTATVFPPWSLPKNIQLPRPTAIQRKERSVALLSIERSPALR